MKSVFSGLGRNFLCLFLGPPGFNWWFIFCSSIPMVLFDTPGISKCLNTFFLLSVEFSYLLHYMFVLFVARNAWFMDQLDLHADRTNICFLSLWKMRRGSESHLPHHLPLTPPQPHTHKLFVISSWSFQGGTFIVVLFVKSSVFFHLLMGFV